MSINPGMLLFALFDAGVAFFLVYSVVKAKFGGNTKAVARTLGTVFGILAFIAEFSAIIWFNLDDHSVIPAARNVVYAAPIVLSILTWILVLLSQPPKQAEEPDGEQEENEAEGSEESEESFS